MVVWIDLDDDFDSPGRSFDRHQLLVRNPSLSKSGTTPDFWSANHAVAAAASYPTPPYMSDLPTTIGDGEKERENPNLNALTEAFACYPIVTEIASHLDLNSLDDLSRTCRQIRCNLLQFRTQLMASTLRCTNESIIPNPDHTLRYRARAADWYFVEPDGGRVLGVGKVGSCARDLVGDCRRCGSIVCRNCTIKPPAPVLLRSRHRRLCPTCVKLPVTTILAASGGATNDSPSTSPRQTPALPTSSQNPSPSILANAPHCTCTNTIYLCQPCGRGLRSADTTYDSIWRWRTRYAGSGIGGLGAGMGEGNRSFECGRGSNCARAKWVEEEVDCDAEDAREVFTGMGLVPREGEVPALGSSFGSSTNGSAPGSSYGSVNSIGNSGGHSMGPGYLRHEIEGIGGVVKKKMVRMVKVGACVQEWEDERERGTYMTGEADGRVRSWCGWCWRPVLGHKDRRELGIDMM